MRVCVFEDAGVQFLEPLTLTRPAFDLWCGASRLLERLRRLVGPCDLGALLRPHLVELARMQHPLMVCNDLAWLRRGPTVFVNARWLPPFVPPSSLGFSEDWTNPRVGLVGQQVAYVIGAAPPDSYPEELDTWLEQCRNSLPMSQAGGSMIEFLWDLVDQNSAALTSDWPWFQQQQGRTSLPANLAVLGNPEKVVIAPGATVEPYVVADTHQGPVLIDQGVQVNSFSRLEGPCYIGRDSWILGAKLRGGTIGPGCRIGGEVEASIVQGFSNKYHDGFLGHSYVGSWVNFGAGTQTSDLRNDYGKVKVTVAGSRVATGQAKVGSFIGDHTKTGLGALLNTGTVVGAFANVLPSGSLSPSLIPSFCQLRHGQLEERCDLRQLFQTAATVMRRRDFELTEAHKELFYTLYDLTSSERRRWLMQHEARRPRLSAL